MRKTLLILAILIAMLASASVASAADTTVTVPGGTLDYNPAGASSFAYDTTMPVDQQWAGYTWDQVTAGWQNAYVLDMVCVDLSLDIPTPGDFGVHCRGWNDLITSDLMTDVALDPTVGTFDLSSPGMSAFPEQADATYGGPDPDPAMLASLPNLTPYTGETLTGHFKVQSWSQAHFNVQPSLDSWITSVGWSGTIADVRTTAGVKSGAPTAPKWGRGVKFHITVPHTAADCHVPAVKGKTVKKAERMLRAHHCGIGRVHHVRAHGVRAGRVVKAALTAGTWRVRGRHIALYVRSAQS